MEKHVMDGIELWNGQVWRQKNFPCFTIIVLMLTHVDGNLMFCKAGWDRFRAPLTMNEEDGKWMYTKEELLAQLKARKYTLIGCAEGGHLLDCEHLEKP